MVVEKRIGTWYNDWSLSRDGGQCLGSFPIMIVGFYQTEPEALKALYRHLVITKGKMNKAWELYQLDKEVFYQHFEEFKLDPSFEDRFNQYYQQGGLDLINESFYNQIVSTPSLLDYVLRSISWDYTDIDDVNDPRYWDGKLIFV